MPAGRGEVERFAAAVELGRTPGLHDVDELARELEIVAMLRSRGAEFAPRPDAKTRAKQRLMAAFAEQHAGARPVVGMSSMAPGSADISAAADGEPTALLDRVGDPVDATAETKAIPCVEDEPEPAPEESAEEPIERAELASVTELVPGTGRKPARRGRARRGASPASAARRRAAIVGAAALVMMVALASTSVFLSRDALPGDALYGVKRVAEEVGLALTFDEEARAQRQLELAALRLDEVSQLVARNEQAAADANLLAQTIQEFGTATSEGSRTLLANEQVVAGGGIGDLQAWAAAQAARLAALRSELPQPVVASADSSIALLDQVLGRTEALQARADCSEIISGIVDGLGPLPAEGLCAPRPGTPESGRSVRSGEPGGAGGGGESADPSGGEPGTAVDTAPGTDGAEVPSAGTPTIRPEGGTVQSRSAEPADKPTPTAGPTSRQPGEDTAIPLPLPLVPPITLPLLGPNGGVITIGG
jgi:hypothetical protein